MKFGISAGPARRPGSMAAGVAPEVDAPHQDRERYMALVQYTREAEQLGFTSISIVEHHFTGFGQPSATLNLLSHLAAVTSVMRLASGVVVPPLKNPMTIAEEAATLDVLSNGRLDLGIGRGYRFNEFRGMNVPLEEATARFDEAVEILERAWTTQERWSFEGTFWSYNDVIVEPEPVQRRPPIWVGASNPSSIEKVARKGWRLMLDQAASFDLIRNRVNVFKEACDANGRAFDPYHIRLSRPLRITEHRDEAWERQIQQPLVDRSEFRKLVFAPDDERIARPDLLPTGDLFAEVNPEDNAILGTPDQCIERLKLLEEMGVGEVALGGGGIDALQLFAKEVVPAFR